MPSPADELAIEYGSYEPHNADDMARLLGDVFSRRDPPAVAVGLTAPEFEAFVRLFCARAAVEGLTVVARNARTRKLLGVLLAEDGASPPPGGIDLVSPKFQPIFDILGELDAEYRRNETVRRGERLHLFLLGVAEPVAGRGVAQELVTRCLESGASKGYRLGVTEATNTVSQHIFRKLGFTARVRRSYATHLFEGHAVFSSIVDHGGPMLMDRPLSS